MTIDAEMRQVLAEMLLCSYGKTVSYNPSGHSVDSGGVPPGTSWSLKDEWQQRWNQAVGTQQKQSVLEEAKDALQTMRKRTAIAPSGETLAQLEARIAGLLSAWNDQDIARECRTSVLIVRRVRRNAALVKANGGDPVDERLHAQQLDAEGCSERTIRMILGCGGSKVRRLLERA